MNEEKSEAFRKSEAFCALYAEWLMVRGRYHAGSCETTAEEDANEARETELAQLITTKPATLPWMIFTKIEVLEHYLGAEGGTTYADNREIVMLAAIKADLRRFEPQAH
jgi:hypothetical protein